MNLQAKNSLSKKKEKRSKKKKEKRSKKKKQKRNKKKKRLNKKMLLLNKKKSHQQKLNKNPQMLPPTVQHLQCQSINKTNLSLQLLLMQKWNINRQLKMNYEKCFYPNCYLINFKFIYY